MRAKGEPPERAKKGSYVRFVDALAELRAIKIACSFLQKIMSAQKLQSLFIALR